VISEFPVCCHAFPTIRKGNNFVTSRNSRKWGSLRLIKKGVSIMKQIIFMPAFTLLTALSALAQQSSHNEETVAQLQAEMASGKLTSVALTQSYINRVLTLDQKGPGVNSVIELNPDALSMAKNADALRANGTVLGPLHGIPVLLKDNIGTGDKM